MGRFRFSIASILVAVLACAVGVAALRESTDLWDAGVFTAAAAALLASALLAFHRDGRGRAYWLGFAAFGGAYLVASLVPPVESRLVTTKGLAYLDSKLPGRAQSFTVQFRQNGSAAGTATAVQALAFSIDGNTLAASGPGRVVRVWDVSTGAWLAGSGGTSENFLRIGHSLLALLVALLGGRVSLRLYDRGRRPPGAEPGPAPPAGPGPVQ